MDLAIYIQPGLFAPRKGGLYDLKTKLRALYPDEGRVWIQVQPHNANNRQVARYVNFLRPRRKVHIGHSLGVGEGLREFADELDILSDTIDLACAIDAVPQFDDWGSFFHTERAFPVPPNVNHILTARTLNRRFLSPWGRRIEDRRVMRRIVYGKNLGPSDGVTLNINDPDVTHANIDEQEDVHDEILLAIQALMGGARP